jgi:hypothetical protein
MTTIAEFEAENIRRSLRDLRRCGEVSDDEEMACLLADGHDGAHGFEFECSCPLRPPIGGQRMLAWECPECSRIWAPYHGTMFSHWEETRGPSW